MVSPGVFLHAVGGVAAISAAFDRFKVSVGSANVRRSDLIIVH
jgi:hypothetical protein